MTTAATCKAPGCNSPAVEALQMVYERGRGPRWLLCREHATLTVQRLQLLRPDLPVENRSVTSI